MCGLYGVIGDGIQVVDIQALKQLATVSQLRGTHASGIIQGRLRANFSEIEVDKINTNYLGHIKFNAKEKFKSPLNREFFAGVNDNIFMGHVRHATIGGHDPANAHPFVCGHITGAHNGTLRTREFVPSKDEGCTDSFKLYSSFEKIGAKETIEKLNPLDAYALTWIDENEKSINIIRNKERTLFWAMNKRRRVFYYASEEVFLLLTAMRLDLDITDPVPFEVDTLYSFQPDDLTIGVTPKWTTEKVFPKGSDVPIQNVRDEWDEWDQWAHWDRFQTIETGKRDEKGRNVVDVAPWYEAEDDDIDQAALADLFGDIEKDGPPISRLISGVAICTQVRTHQTVFCVVCNKKMSLLDQYYGTVYEFGSELTAVHAQCE